MRVLSDMIEANMDRNQLEEYLQRKVQASDDVKKVIQ